MVGYTRQPHQGIDKYAIVGAGAAIAILSLFYICLVGKHAERLSLATFLVGATIAISPLMVARRVYQVAGARLFTDWRDFMVTIAWIPILVVTLVATQDPTVILAGTACGLLIDSFVTGKTRTRYTPWMRVIVSYGRILSGIIGILIAITFLANVMDIGNPKNKKSLGQGLFGAIIWGYCGKKFFDFIGVTKPISLSTLLSGQRLP